MDDGKTEVLFEIDEQKSVRGPLGLKEDLKKKFSEIMELVEQTAKSAHEGYKNIPEDVKPREMELSFGIKLNAEKGLIFSKAGGEGNFQVTLKWGKA